MSNYKHCELQDSDPHNDVALLRDAKRAPIHVSGASFVKVEKIYQSYNPEEEEWRRLDIENLDPDEI